MAAAVATLALVVLIPPTGAQATPADTAATHAYLQARYDYFLAALRAAPAARAGFMAASERLGRECPGVLAHAPRNELVSESSDSPVPPRVKGERERAERQLVTIDGEISFTLAAPEASAYRPAVEAFLAATAPLSWSDAKITQLVQTNAATLREPFATSAPDACADMKAWAASGYSSLTPASRAFREAQTAIAERVASEASLSAVLKPYEGPAERALIARIDALRRKLVIAVTGNLGRLYARLLRELGVPESSPEQRRRAPALAHGTTRSGATFTVRRRGRHESLESGCSREVSVELTEKPPKGKGPSFSNSSSGPVCLSPLRAKRVQLACSEGEVSITLAVPGNVHAVRLRLGDGTAITSSVAQISRKRGGPGGIYVQALRGAGRRALSLTELDAGGRIVKVVKVKAPHCRREPQPTGPKLFKLVQGTAPDGTPYTIEGALVEFPGHESSFSVNAQTGLEGSSEEEASIAVGPLGGVPKPSPWHHLVGCPPHPGAPCSRAPPKGSSRSPSSNSTQSCTPTARSSTASSRPCRVN